MDGGFVRVSAIAVWEAGEEGCAYILDGGGRCAALRREGSSYCAHHHTLCHVAEDSRRGRRRLRETEALANAVGGRAARRDRLPPDRFLKRLENIARGFSRPKCSCFVLKGDGQ